MISPDYFSLRWRLYQAALNRQEQPVGYCNVEVRRLPVRVSGEDAFEYVPYAVHPEIERTISTSLCKLQDYAVRYIVKGDKVSAHQLPQMDKAIHRMVAYLRKQNPYLSPDLLHHWCVDPKGAMALLRVYEVLWEQAWRQDRMDAAPWLPAVNILLLKLIRQNITELSSEHMDQTGDVILNVLGGIYTWKLQSFLESHLEGESDMDHIASYALMMLPVTPMAFLQYQLDASLLGDDSRVIRAYGLEPEIVPRMRYLHAKGGAHNENEMLQLLAEDQLGARLQRRTWVRMSLWKLSVDSGCGGWMRFVQNAKRLDQLLSGNIHLEGILMKNLQANQETPVARWLLEQSTGSRTKKSMGDPWLKDNITLLAFRVFEEDVRVEVALRLSEKTWRDRKQGFDGTGALATAPHRPDGVNRSSDIFSGGGFRGDRLGSRKAGDSETALNKAWHDGELILIQPDVTKALHSGRALSQRQGCLKVEWSEYLAKIHALHGGNASDFMAKTFLPGVLALIGNRDKLFLDMCSASGCLLRGSALELAETGIALRIRLRGWLVESLSRYNIAIDDVHMPALSMCMGMAGEWTFAELTDSKQGQQRIAFSQAICQVDAGVCRDSNVERLLHVRDAKHGVKSIGRVNVRAVKVADGQIVQMLHNTGFAFTASAKTELTAMLANKAVIRNFRLDKLQVQGVLDGYCLPPGGLDLLVIQRHGYESESPWLLMKAGKPSLAGINMDIFELLDGDLLASQCIIEHGLKRWQ
ncbi:MAG: hypothetical protein Q9M08_02420 [Mariprofundus sp.]|nr:hypothetical protein [Mariprofundus sp.]